MGNQNGIPAEPGCAFIPQPVLINPENEHIHPMRRSISLWFILFLTPFLVFAQNQNCGLESPWDIPSVGPRDTVKQTFEIEVAGYNNDILSNPDQGLCGIDLSLFSSTLLYLEIWLESPSGQRIQLIGPAIEENKITFGANWQISFVPLSVAPQPQPGGYAARWTNDPDLTFSINGGGTYHPFDGDLEDINLGTVNGTWKVIVWNYPNSYDSNGGPATRIYNFHLNFCNEDGVACCFADGGELTGVPDTLLCEGDPALDIPQPGVAYFLSARPDEIDYRYGFLVVRDGVVEALVDDPDLSGAPPGEYRILGLSYSALDDNTVKNLPYGVLTLADLEADLASATPAFCGSLSENAINIGVGAPPPPERIDTVICQGEEFPAADTMLATSGVYNFNLLTAFGCDSLLEVDLTVLEPDTNFLIEPICPGDSLVVGSTAFYTPGNYEIGLTNQQGCDSIIFLELSWWPTPVTDLDTVICAGEILTIGGQSFSATGDYTVGLSTVNGCDSTVNLSLTVLAPEAVIDPPETITCDRTEVSLLGNNSLPASGLSYAWTDAGGTSLGGGPFLTVDRPGIYDLIVFQSQSGVTCTDTSRVEVTDERTFPAALVEPPSAVTCAMPELLLDGTLSTQAPQIKYRWETTGGRFASATDQAFVSVAAGGEYRLLVIDTLNGCQDTATVQVLEDRAAPLADAGGDRMLTCAEPSLVLDGSNSSAGPAFEYQWLSAAGLPVSGSDTPTPLVDEPGAYQLMVTDTRNGCAASDTATVGIDTIPPAVFIADPP